MQAQDRFDWRVTATLEARGPAKRYNGAVALDSFDLAVSQEEIICLLGANGAGRTTTVNPFLGFLSPAAGRTPGIFTSGFFPSREHRIFTIRYIISIKVSNVSDEREAFSSRSGKRLARRLR